MGALSQQQVDELRDDGFTVLRGAVGEAALRRLEAGYARNPPTDKGLEGRPWPAPGRYTLARNALADPDLAFLAASPEVVEPLRAALDDDPKLLMWALYDRTPGGEGLPPHQDYKRWRPIGSSMRWVFGIVPLSDWDDAQGPLLLSPGSHRVAHRPEDGTGVWTADRPVRPPDDSFVDPHLRRGDLAIVDMHTWHRAAPNTSDRHRVGMFTKWSAASAPPATGFYPHNEAVRAALGPEGGHILGSASDLPITTTRAVLERVNARGRRYLFVDDGDGLCLPGGPTRREGSIPDWDDGNFIASLGDALADRIGVRTPWATWLGDYDEGGDHRCRVYCYRLAPEGWGISGHGSQWLSPDDLVARAGELAYGYEPDAIAEWCRDGVVRGKGVTEALARSDQFAC